MTLARRWRLCVVQVLVVSMVTETRETCQKATSGGSSRPCGDQAAHCGRGFHHQMFPSSRWVETLRAPEGEFGQSEASLVLLKRSHAVNTETCELKSSSNSTNRRAKWHRAASCFLQLRPEENMRRHVFFTSDKSWCVCSHTCHMYDCTCLLNPQVSVSARNYIYLFLVFFPYSCLLRAAVIAALSTCSSVAPGNMKISAY